MQSEDFRPIRVGLVHRGDAMFIVTDSDAETLSTVFRPVLSDHIAKMMIPGEDLEALLDNVQGPFILDCLVVPEHVHEAPAKEPIHHDAFMDVIMHPQGETYGPLVLLHHTLFSLGVIPTPILPT